MSQVVIENPIINSPFEEPSRHFKFDDEGITNVQVGGGYVGVTPTTARLIEHWTNPDREKRLFFFQNEALETAIYITEVAKKYGDAWIENILREANDGSNPGLPRMAFKMATGSGKSRALGRIFSGGWASKMEIPA